MPLSTHVQPAGLTGIEFETLYLSKEFIPELQGLGYVVVPHKQFSRKDLLGLDFEVLRGGSREYAVQVKLRLDILHIRPLRKAADTILTMETLRAWCAGKVDAVTTLEKGKQWVSAMRETNSPMLASY